MPIQKRQISLKELSELHDLSVRSLNVCRDNNLNTLSRLLQFYLKGNSFLSLKNCGAKSSEELVKLCQYYLTSTPPDFSLSSPSHENGISQRDVDFCTQNTIDNIGKLLQLVSEDRLLYDVLPSGLKKLFIRHQSSTLFSNDNDETFNFREKKTIVDLLTKKKLAQLEILFTTELEGLSTRSRNAMYALFKGNNESLKNLFKSLKKLDFNFRLLDNLGTKSAKELTLFFNKIRKYALLLHEGDDDNLLEKIALHSINSILEKPLPTIEPFIDDETEDLKIFFFLHYLIEGNFLLDDRQTYIFIHHSDYIEDSDKKTLEQIGEKYGVSRERIRQISQPDKLYIPFWQKVASLFQILQDSFHKFDADTFRYGINPQDNILIINSDEINQIEDTGFSEYFLYQTFSTLIPDLLPVIKIKEIYPKYLVKEKFFEKIQLSNLIQDITEITESKIEKTFKINLKGFLYPYQKEILYDDQLDESISIIERILLEEFSIISDLEGDITIHRNTKKQIYEYLLEILEQEDKPLHVKEIHGILKKKYPNLKTSKSSIRSQLIHLKNLFINVGPSTYGLKEWEESGRYISGSIKDLVELYLDRFDEPKHIYEISKFVTEHRDTKKSHIYSNIQIDPHNRFVIYSSGFVGLPNKNYSEDSVKFNSFSNVISRNFSQHFFTGNKSKMTVTEIVKTIVNNNDLKEAQVLSFIEDKIDDDEYYVSGGFLYKK